MRFWRISISNIAPDNPDIVGTTLWKQGVSFLNQLQIDRQSSLNMSF